MNDDLAPGLSAARTFIVSDADTAKALGSGSLRVLGTPRVLAWAEAVTCAAIQNVLAVGTTSVGARVSLEHMVPSPVGDEVRVAATVTQVDGRAVTFGVEASDATGRALARGEVVRAIVGADAFMARIRPDH
ncbi:MAG: thioesterase [Actinomycetia bacterium]|nr:thioesterase [Actinomycetes bacterium]